MKFNLKFFTTEKAIPWILFAIALGVVFTQAFQNCNNFIIFKNSFLHLIHNQDLYKEYPSEYGDIFLYTPAFALFMAPFAYLPHLAGVLLWCILNCLCVYCAVKYLPFEQSQKKIWLLYLATFELITSLQSLQTSPMVASFIILSFIFFERKNVFLAAFFIILASFIKIYALAAALMFLLYPNRLKFLASMCLWGVVFLLIPLVAVSFKQLLSIYQSWYHTTVAVHQSEETGINPNITTPLSVMGWLKTWFHFSPPVVYTQLIGTSFLCAPVLYSFLRSPVEESEKMRKRESEKNLLPHTFPPSHSLTFRFLVLSSILIWALIFNHIAESPSYIIPVFGCSIWFLADEKNRLSIALIILCFIFTSLSATDLFPRPIRLNYAQPYVWKAVPCIFIWLYIQYRLWKTRFGNSQQL